MYIHIRALISISPAITYTLMKLIYTIIFLLLSALLLAQNEAPAKKSSFESGSELVRNARNFSCYYRSIDTQLDYISGYSSGIQKIN